MKLSRKDAAAHAARCGVAVPQERPGRARKAPTVKLPAMLRGGCVLWLHIVLPWPPSVNTYWRHGRGRTYISKAGLEYRERVGEACLLQKVQHVEGRLRVRIYATPPDERVRDLDNTFKASLDALAEAGVYASDGQVDDLHITRLSPVGPGNLVVEIATL